MKKLGNKLAYILIGMILAIAGTVYAAVSVPNATQKGDLPTGKTTGNYQLLHPGADGTVPIASSTSANGIVWGTVSGSLSGGTNGYVARWTSASTLSSGILIDNGTVAGVNATGSATSFLIQGTTTLNPFQVNSSSGATLLQVTSGGNVNIATLTASSLVQTDASKNLSSSSLLINNIIQNVSTGTVGNNFNISTSTNALVINLPNASASNNGQLLAADWTTFNNKVSTTRAINTTAPITGGGDLSADRTIACNVASIAQAGCLASADFLTFNNKLSGAATANQIAFYSAATTTTGSALFTFTTTGGLTNTATSTLATTTITQLTVTGTPTLSGVSNCNGTQFLQITSGLFGCGTPAGGGGGANAFATSSPQYIYSNYPTATGTMVGINSSTPIANLSVVGGVGSTSPEFMVASSSGASNLQVNSNGQVGIGTSSPPTTLAVSGTALISSTSTFVSGLTIGLGPLGADTWINLPTTGASGIGTGGAGSNPFMAYVFGPNNWFNGAVNGDVAYRNATGKRILMGIDNGSGNANPQIILSGGNLVNINTGNFSVATLTATQLVMTDANKNLISNTLGTGLSFSGTTLNASNAFTGSGAANQINYWTSATGQAGSANFLWFNTAQMQSINSATPTATLTVQASSSSQTLPVFTVASSSNPMFTVNPNNNIVFQNEGLPTLASQKFFTVVGSQAGGVARIIRDVGLNPLANTFYGTYDITAYSATSTTDWPDGTGPIQTFSIATGTMQQIVGQIAVAKSGVDTTGRFSFSAFNNGVGREILALNGNSSFSSGYIQGIPGASSIFAVASSTSQILFGVSNYGQTIIGTTTFNSLTPLLFVQGTSSSPSMPLLGVASSSGISFLNIDQNGLTTFRQTSTSTTAFAIQNPSAQSILNIDTTAIGSSPSSFILTIASSSGANLFNVNGFGDTFLNHLVGSSSLPTIATSTGLGTGGCTSTLCQATVIPGSTDLAGAIKAGVGTSPAANTTLATLTFNRTFITAPFCQVTNASSTTSTIWATTTSSTLVLESNTALPASGDGFEWYYQCTGQLGG